MRHILNHWNRFKSWLLNNLECLLDRFFPHVLTRFRNLSDEITLFEHDQIAPLYLEPNDHSNSRVYHLHHQLNRYTIRLKINPFYNMQLRQTLEKKITSLHQFLLTYQEISTKFLQLAQEIAIFEQKHIDPLTLDTEDPSDSQMQRLDAILDTYFTRLNDIPLNFNQHRQILEKKIATLHQFLSTYSEISKKFHQLSEDITIFEHDQITPLYLNAEDLSNSQIQQLYAILDSYLERLNAIHLGFTKNRKILEKKIVTFRQFLTTYPEISLKFRQLSDNIHFFLEDQIDPFQDYPEYLPKTQIAKLQGQITTHLRDIHDFIDMFTVHKQKLNERLIESQKFLTEYNEAYIEHALKKYAKFLSKLNKEQKIAILINDLNNLLVAGPGSGKTRVVIDRVAFYILHHHIPPEQVLILAFNNAVTKEIRERFRTQYRLENLHILTFHGLGLKILISLQKSNLISLSHFKIDNNADKTLASLISKLRESDTAFLVDFTSFFVHYLHQVDSTVHKQISMQQFTHSTTTEYIAMDKTRVKSIAERDIANFFIRHNIVYQYESLVTWCDEDSNPIDPAHPRTYHPDFYLPEYDIYLEHWAIGEDGTPPEWFDGDPKKYARERDWKRHQFQKYNKTLWETAYPDWRTGQLEMKLSTYCYKFKIPLITRSHEDLLQEIGKSSLDTGILMNLIISYIHMAKTNGFSANSFEQKLHRELGHISNSDVSFFFLVLKVFRQYEIHQQTYQLIDFDDMINFAVAALSRPECFTFIQSLLPYSMIFVDEFQDISLQRYDLLRFVAQFLPSCRLFCVGDDWQAIYGFTGASTRFLTHYHDYFPGGELNFLNQNYRNPPSLLSFGSQIIRRTSDFISKQFKPVQPDSNACIQITRVPASNYQSFLHIQATRVIRLLYSLIVTERQSPSEILVLSRYTFGYDLIRQTCQANGQFPVELVKEGQAVKSGIRFMTVHKSKGLESDIVIILGVIDDLLGFPSNIETMVNVAFVNPHLSPKFDEEARLFFVALTRARKRVYLFTWLDHESTFIPLKPTLQQVLKVYKRQNYVFAQIIATTDKAINLETIVDFEEPFEFWIPKTAINCPYSPELLISQQFTFAPWWVNQKFTDRKIPNYFI